MTQQRDAVGIYEIAVGQARKVLKEVTSEQMGRTTPCSEWDVEGLINHLVGAQTRIAGMISGSKVTPGTDTTETLEAAVAAMVAAATAPGGLDKMVQGRQGEVPARQMLDIGTMDLAIHTWDLAKATQQDTALDPQVVEHIQPLVERMTSGGVTPAYGPPTEVLPGANAQDQMIAMSGRTV